MNLNAKAARENDDPFTAIAFSHIGTVFVHLAQWADVAWAKSLLVKLQAIVLQHDHASCTDEGCLLPAKFQAHLEQHLDPEDALDLDVLLRPALQLIPEVTLEQFAEILDQTAQIGGLT